MHFRSEKFQVDLTMLAAQAHDATMRHPPRGSHGGAADCRLPGAGTGSSRNVPCRTSAFLGPGPSKKRKFILFDLFIHSQSTYLSIKFMHLDTLERTTYLQRRNFTSAVAEECKTCHLFDFDLSWHCASACQLRSLVRNGWQLECSPAWTQVWNAILALTFGWMAVSCRAPSASTATGTLARSATPIATLLR